MKYIELIERKLTKEELAIPGLYVGDIRLWTDKEPGMYVVEDSLGKQLAVWTGSYCSAIPIMSDMLKDTKPTLEEDVIHKHLVLIGKQIEKLISKPDQVVKQSGNIFDNDTFLKALAVAQKPDLIKDI